VVGLSGRNKFDDIFISILIQYWRLTDRQTCNDGKDRATQSVTWVRTRMIGTRPRNKFDPIFSRLYTIHKCDRRADRQTDR